MAWWGSPLAENELSHFLLLVRLVKKKEKKLKECDREREKLSHIRERRRRTR